jgi:hypothetical protein
MLPEEIEPVLRKNQAKIQTVGWISFERKNAWKSVIGSKSSIEDVSRTYQSDKYRYYGITPELIDTTKGEEYDKFVEVDYSATPGY